MLMGALSKGTGLSTAKPQRGQIELRDPDRRLLDGLSRFIPSWVHDLELTPVGLVKGPAG